MIADIAKTLLEALKLAPRYLIALGLIAAFLLFSPEDHLKRLGVFDITQNNRAWLGVTLIASTALFLVSLSVDGIRWVRHLWWRRKLRKSITERLHRLTEDEKQILRYYVASQSRANTLRIDDGVVQGLVAAGILFRSASLGNLMEGFAHNISDIAWDYIHTHPELLDGSTNTYRTDKINWGI